MNLETQVKAKKSLLNTTLTLEQLEQMKQYGYKRVPYAEALEKMGFNESNNELEYSYDMGDEERAEETYIEEQKLIKKERELNSKHITDFTYSGIVNLISQEHPRPQDDYSTIFMREQIESMVEKMKAGETTDILTVLTTNLMQIQSFNGRVTRNMGKDEMSYKNWELLSKMQMKLLQESRKTAMAINEICNPKRATFVKTAIQNNHLNSEKNNEHINELSQPIEENTIDANQYTEAETVTEGTDK